VDSSGEGNNIGREGNFTSTEESEFEWVVFDERWVKAFGTALNIPYIYNKLCQ
jgi:hypothetical protein